MATEAYEDALDLQIDLLETLQPDADSYPYVRLEPTGVRESRQFRSLVLENPFLKIQVVPALGGRVLSIFDKRTNTEILPRSKALSPTPGGRRGVLLTDGLRFELGLAERLNDLGNVDTLLEPAEDEDSPADLWIAESWAGNPLSFHLRITLPPDRAEVLFEARVLNRGLKPEPYNGRLEISLANGVLCDRAFYDPERRAGLLLLDGDHPLEAFNLEDGLLTLARFQSPRELAPRQLDTWTARLIPFSGLEGISCSSSEGAAFLTSGSLNIQTTQLRRAHKLLILTEDGQTLETSVDLYPERLLEIPLSALPSRPAAIVLQDQNREVVLRSDVASPLEEPSPVPPAAQAPDWEAATDSELRQRTFEVGHRHTAYLQLGMRSLASGDYRMANDRFEQALLYNAEDHLTWWAKAVAQRLLGGDTEERVEWLNAHFLAPLEPALRAESFLGLTTPQGKDKNPLLNLLEQNPECFIEVACLYIEAGLFDQATRWIDESLRHSDMPMLHFLQAYCFVAASRMQAEAADHVLKASRLEFGPPYPWRPVELKALKKLLESFPTDPALQRLASLASVAH